MSKEDAVLGGGTLVLAFMAGAVTGAALALLFAPASGEDARHYLSERARRGRERASEAARQGREFIRTQGDQVRQMVARGREEYQRARAGEPGPEETV